MDKLYRIVPVEPTEEMMKAAFGSTQSLRHIWKVMLAAAPDQPEPAALSLEPVAEVMTAHSLHWAGTGPIGPLCERTGVKVGSKLVSLEQAQAYIEREREAIRNEALEDAAKVPRAYAEQLDKAGWGNRFPDELTAIFNATPNMEYQILRLKSQPAQPSDSQAEVSDTDLTDLMESENPTIKPENIPIADTGDYDGEIVVYTSCMNPRDQKRLGSGGTYREAIKDAMLSQEES